MTADGIVISALLSAVLGLLGFIYRGIRTEIDRLRVNFHNFTRATFELLSRLHPGSSQVILEAQTDYYQNCEDTGRYPNGEFRVRSASRGD